jgi:L-lysine 6-transaminase
MKDINPKNVHKVLKDHILLDGYDMVLDLEKSEGSYIYDSKHGKKFLDFFTGFASMPIGYNHPEMMNDEFIREMGLLAINKPANSDLYTEVYASFVENFFKKAVPSAFKHSFYIAGGALAVENAMKAAFDWKTRLNISKGLSSDLGNKVIYLNEAFHGRSGYTLSVTNTLPDKVMLFPRFDWIKVSNPKIVNPLEGKNLEDTEKAEHQSIKEIEKAISKYPDDIACILLEPIQGEGGDNHFRPEYLKKLREICDDNDIMLIFDEVQTGGGLTGTFWVHEQLGVTPDILAFGKKMQVCGILSTDRIDSVDNTVFQRSSRINSTWGGDLVDMLRCNKYLDIIYGDNLLENVQEISKLLMQKLNVLADKHPGKIYNIRGRGLFAAFDIDQFLRGEFLKNCMDRNLIILSCGKQSVRFRPPLNLSTVELDEGIEIIDRSLSAL